VIAQRMAPKLTGFRGTPEENQLYRDIQRVYDARHAAMTRGKLNPEKPAEAPKPAETPKAEAPKPTAKKPKGPMSQAEFKRWRASPEGKVSREEIQYQTGKKQLDEDARLIKSNRSPRPVPRGGKKEPLKLKDEPNGRSGKEPIRQFDKSRRDKYSSAEPRSKRSSA
jgi:hypothetical protein